MTRVESLYRSLDGDGPPVVLLHAGGLDSRMFELDMPRLAELARVLRYDRSGSGRSPACDRPVDRVDELRSVAATAFGERPAVLVGSSFGGQLAVDLALALPAHVAGLLLVGPGLSGVGPSLSQRARISRLEAAARQSPDRLADAWLKDPHLAPHGLPGPAAELVRTMLRDNAGLFAAPSMSLAAASALARLGGLAVPGRVVVGEHDDADHHAIAETLARGAPALELQIVPGAGHFPMLARPGWLPEALGKLLERLDQPGAR